LSVRFKILLLCPVLGKIVEYACTFVNFVGVVKPYLLAFQKCTRLGVISYDEKGTDHNAMYQDYLKKCGTGNLLVK
jgi:hypothetical protein